VSLLRVVIVGITRTGLFSVAFFFSLGGAFLSIIMMSLFKKLTNLSVIGVSIIGSISHSIGQIIMAIILIKSNLMVMYLPWLLMFSIPTGIITGKIALKMLENFKELNEVGVSLY
jgi:heptaprenyl diphosphate synthase